MPRLPRIVIFLTSHKIQSKIVACKSHLSVQAVLLYTTVDNFYAILFWFMSTFAKHAVCYVSLAQ